MFIYAHICVCSAHSHTHALSIPTTTRFSTHNHTLPKQPPSRCTHAQHPIHLPQSASRHLLALTTQGQTPVPASGKQQQQPEEETKP